MTDAYYTKTLITEAILEQGLHQIGKLRHDANLRYLYQGPQKPKADRVSMMANSSWVKRRV